MPAKNMQILRNRPASNAPSRMAARQASQRLSQYVDGDLEVTFSGSRDSFTLPRDIVRSLVDLLAQFAQGRGVAIVPRDAEYTTHQAADYLGVSRPFIVKILEAGDIPYRKVGTHRRIFFKDLLAYREKTLHNRRQALDELTAVAQRDGYDY